MSAGERVAAFSLGERDGSGGGLSSGNNMMGRSHSVAGVADRVVKSDTMSFLAPDRRPEPVRELRW